MKILALHLYSILEYAQLRGLTAKEMFDGMTPVSTNDSESTIPEEDFFKVIRNIDLHLKDEMLGVRIGTFMNLKSLGVIYQISLQTTVIQEALAYLKDYVNATLPVISIETSVSDLYASIVLKSKDDAKAEHKILLENILTVIAKELKVMAGTDLKIEIFSPGYHSGYPPEWEHADSYSIRFVNGILKASMHDRSRWNLDILVPEYLRMIETLKQEESFASKVKIALLSMAKPELPDLAVVADNFNMTTRTFQRRLVSEKSSFREIMLDVKKQISYHLINHERFSVNDISDVLGFSETASFIHSFKKWYGNSPDKFRRQRMSA
jgi:AraC-like DNA-binding protein